MNPGEAALERAFNSASMLYGRGVSRSRFIAGVKTSNGVYLVVAGVQMTGVTARVFTISCSAMVLQQLRNGA